MKNIISFAEFTNADLKPTALIDRYKTLTVEGIQQFFDQPSRVSILVCPACQSGNSDSAFQKMGMDYLLCRACGTLYVAPRPTDEAIKQFYIHSAARQFWNQELSKTTKDKRETKILKPRYQWVLDSTQENMSTAMHIVDVHPNQAVSLIELASLEGFTRKTVVMPLFDTASAETSKQVEVINSPLDQASLSNADVVTLFEVLDRTSDANTLLKAVNRILKPKGLCFVTAILTSGFDIQTLWSEAPNLYPPDRLNVFSLEGIKRLFERNDFECLEISTPGILDLENVKQAEQAVMPRFLKYLFEHRDDAVRKSFQQFLQSSLLSSYGRFLIQKRVKG
ncbi:MAG: hypothetical protein COV74_09770 [Candidatus Omnitrophica bacterium CG11_big_fil_rev_8_21_14_0_20_45_26]|uniref:Methyltransferase type 11 domain-containing protein n=1 Tax=Candidatus Abzuiibacterium crystallinum TaxID=1974748 RepID=A0A2H0LLK1_9BACT|nr:MAG: hypothetical protein COV74_09770 [Candidatus Omnitrophica bacterium CG11_big_fil_rev_8_21_14_0_20_45_26]PIW64495.1 MAG: hypothetical protein COW12_05895 [Candidatus Omnitrophica bacterium CG12_big_fil_rev_8_21_14_0_65_45_16]